MLFFLPSMVVEKESFLGFLSTFEERICPCWKRVFFSLPFLHFLTLGLILLGPESRLSVCLVFCIHIIACLAVSWFPFFV